MIFTMVGTHNLGFERLVKRMDEIAKKEKVIIQKGTTSYMPKNAEYFDFAGLKTIYDYIENAEVVVTHGGVGCVTDSLEYGKPTVIVPRLKKYNEHTNDHQLDLAKEMKKEKRAIMVMDIEKLENAIKDSRLLDVHKKKGEDRVVSIINEYLRSVA